MNRSIDTIYSAYPARHYDLAQRVLDEADAVKRAAESIHGDVDNNAHAIGPGALDRTLAMLHEVREMLSGAMGDLD